MTGRRLVNALASVEPLDRQLESGIGELRSRPSSARTLAILVVGRPRNLCQLVQRSSHPVEGGIVETLAPAAAEFLFGELPGPLALSNRYPGLICHRSPGNTQASHRTARGT